MMHRGPFSSFVHCLKGGNRAGLPVRLLNPPPVLQ
jgi:hypothetical protein